MSEDSKKIVLIRHGESVWNKENLFTGWTDVDLSARGMSEAKSAGQLLKQAGFQFNVAYTSVLKRAIKTLDVVLEEMDMLWLEVHKTWLLNERHYGALQGLNKAETAKKYGQAQVDIWRRSYDVPPPALADGDKRLPQLEAKYANVSSNLLPRAESLKDTVARVMPFWHSQIEPLIASNKKLIIAAHGNSLRALVKYLQQISDNDIATLNIPTGVPLVYEFNEDMSVNKHYYLGDADKIAAAIDSVKNQSLAKK